MKPLRFLTNAILEWRPKAQRHSSPEMADSPPDLEVDSISTATSPGKSAAVIPPVVRKEHWRKSRPEHNNHPPVMVAMTIVALTSVVGYRFYNQPQLTVGTISPSRIVAPRDGQFEDPKTTEERRKAVRTATVPILKRDLDTTATINFALEQALDNMQQLRLQSGEFPYVDTAILTRPHQQVLRTLSSEQLQQLPQMLSGKLTPPNNLIGAIAALRNYQAEATPEEFSRLLRQARQAQERYQSVLINESDDLPFTLSQANKVTLLVLSQVNWELSEQGIRAATKNILTQGILDGMPSLLLQETIKTQVQSLIPNTSHGIAFELINSIVKPNLVEDREETKRQATQAARSVDPVIVEVKKGQVIVEANEKITQADFVVLDHLGLSRRGVNWQGLVITVVMVAGTFTAFWLVVKRIRRPLRRRDHFLLCLLSLSTPLLIIFNVRYTNLPAIGLLTSSFYGPTLAVTQVVLLTALSAFGATSLGWEYLLAGTAGGILTAVITSRLRSREEMALLGLATGLTQGGVSFMINLILSASAGTIWYVVLPEAAVVGVSGLGWVIVALGLSPYLERLFDLVTPIRLAELSNPNRPLLKRLAKEAPGTFQHTTFVASLAEAAAQELHCNVELVRAGTLYHDIGKMHDPQGFIENQMGGPNKHDQINDPLISAAIIKKHVSEGLVMARKVGLPRAIQDFIPEHQGTLLISYFFYQAQQQAEANSEAAIDEADFRYDGPIPQCRETGIVMLADGCEAALRSLKEATPEKALSMINKIFKARWRDNQLVDSGIQYSELPVIAEVFVQVWQQSNHQRIAYPQAALEPRTSSVPSQTSLSNS